MSTIRPAFASPELQAVLDQSRAALEGADEARNKVSQDIKALEAYLTSLSLPTPFRYSLGMCLVVDDESGVEAALEYSGRADGKIEEQALFLAPDSHQKVRLMYEVSRWDGFIDVDMPGGPYFWEADTLERDIKPLIETKFDIRKKVYSNLPAFVAALAKHCVIVPNKFPDVDAEIPF